MKKLADDCFLHDKDRMRHDEAIALLRDRVTPVTGTVTTRLEEAAGRILAQDITAPRNIPAFDNSAVDGYAFAHEDHDPAGGFFPLTARIAAGDDNEVELPGFSAARIFTGARMPLGADTIAMQEDCETHEQDGKKFVIVPTGLKPGANRRKAGEDVSAGETIATQKFRLRPQDLAAIASTGIGTIETYRPLRIGLVSSGEEIIRPGEAFSDGKVYDANHFMLRGLLNTPLFEVTDLGICPDDRSRVEELLASASDEFDAVITIGGASRGEEDHFVDVLETLGTCQMWQIAVKPGRPLAFGQIAGTPCFTLPGNPVAAFVCFLLYVRPSLMVMAGGEWHESPRYPLPTDFAINSKPDRREFLRGFLTKDANGTPMVQKFRRDGSGLITGLREAHGLIEITEETTSVAKGDTVNFIPFAELWA